MPKACDKRIGRRSFVQSAGALAAAPLLGGLATRDDLREIEGALATIPVQGARYSETSQRMIDR